MQRPTLRPFNTDCHRRRAVNERKPTKTANDYQAPAPKVQSFMVARDRFRRVGDDRSVEEYADAQEALLAEGECLFAARARAVCLIEMSIKDIECEITAKFMRRVGVDSLRSFGVHVNDDPVADESSGLLDDDFIL